MFGLVRLCTFAAGAAMLALAASPTRVLILTGSSDEPYHHWRETTVSIRAALDRAGIFEVKTAEEPGALSDSALAGYDVLVVNYNGPRWGAASESAVEKFVRSGKGLAAFHLCTHGSFFGQRQRPGGGFEQVDGGWKAWPEMIGATWQPANIGHARRGPFTVRWTAAQHAIAEGLPREWSANDELYHKIDLKPSAKVLADAFSEKDVGGTGSREPLIWTNQYGKGRVFYTTLGHDRAAFYQPGMINAFARGVEWAARGSVAIPLMDTHHSRSKDDVRVLVVTGGHAYPVAFYSTLNALPGIQWKHAALHAEVRSPIEKQFDVVLLHDMHETISDEMKARLQAFVEGGGGVISLHHAIVDFTSWPWWYQEVIGGKYFQTAVEGHAKSSYHEDVEFVVTPAKGKERHPVLAGVGPLTVYDELYRNMWLSPKIEVLMETAHPENDRPIVYVGPHPRARAVYIQLGHSDHTMGHPGFQRLMTNAIRWTARREQAGQTK